MARAQNKIKQFINFLLRKSYSIFELEPNMQMSFLRLGLCACIAFWLNLSALMTTAQAAPTPVECARIRGQIASLSAQIRELQAELRTAPTGAKSRLVSEIKNLGIALAAKRRSGAQCPPISNCGREVCVQDPASSNQRCKICRTDNCDGTASVSHTC